MIKNLGNQLQALGRQEIPAVINLTESTYKYTRTFKHDFFAFTALYTITDSNLQSTSPGNIVLKINRTGDILGLPLNWIGRHLQNNECGILKQLTHLPGTPRFLSQFGDTGLVYEYIEGRSLDQTQELPDDFFDNLESLIKSVHAHHIAYIDMNKKGNILVGEDRKPWLIDFQISIRIDWNKPWKAIGQMILNRLQAEDLYHLNKHKRRFLRKKMPKAEYLKTYRTSKLIQLHRILFRPLTLLRRRILGHLFDTGQINIDPHSQMTPENDPTRYSSRTHQ